MWGVLGLVFFFSNLKILNTRRMSIKEWLMIFECFESGIFRISRQIVGSIMLLNKKLSETLYFWFSYIVAVCLGKERTIYYLPYLLIHELQWSGLRNRIAAIYALIIYVWFGLHNYFFIQFKKKCIVAMETATSWDLDYCEEAGYFINK